jgi:hypothetical protein
MVRRISSVLKPSAMGRVTPGTDDVIGFELQVVANDLTQAMKIISGCLPA